MDTGNIARPQQAANVAPVPRTEAPAAVAGVKTELRVEQSVRQAGESEASRFETRPGLSSQVALDTAFREALDRDIVVDEDTHSLVYQTIDEKTGEVIRQLPDETMLKLRAYVRDLAEARSARLEHDVEKRA